MKKRGLGRGLDALLSSAGASAGPEAGEELLDLPLEQLQPGKHQPRRSFDQDALQALADSIKAQGVVQPIVARSSAPGKYEIVAGERRWRASQMAGLKTIPALVRPLADRAAMAVALVENIQRSDLNPLEEAIALKRLIEDVGLTHEQCSSAVGRSRAAVTNLLRLFELNAEVQEWLRDNKLSLGHAKALLGLTGPRQSSLAAQVVARHYSVRQTEDLVRAALSTRPAKTRKGARPPIEAELSAKLGLPVRVEQTAQGAGKLTVKFKQKSEFDKLLKLLR